jgi:DNA-binding transcriptional MerR regulator
MRNVAATRNQTTRQYSLTELAEEAGVSVRTVRYYIVEGLLPPAHIAGARSYYTQAHLDRLRLIGQLKAAYLPLKEIRRRLAGLDDEEVHRLVAGVPAAGPAAETAPQLDSAATYLARLRSRAFGAGDTSPATLPASTPFAAFDIPPSVLASRHLTATSETERAQTEEAEGPWRRVRLSDDAELLIREEVYQRKHDRIDWLIRWARKVFG